MSGSFLKTNIRRRSLIASLAAGFAIAASPLAMGSAKPKTLDANFNAVIVANRLTGVAPFMLHVDATDTTSVYVADTFRQILYNWNYGDTTTETWAIDGTNKNVDSGGPLGGHVYKTPGNYTVTLIATDGVNSRQVQLAITVLNPATVYAGNKTICMSTDGSTGWGPAGAQYLTALPSIPSLANKRLMFKRGQNFVSLGNIQIDQDAHDLQIVAGGPGSKKAVLSGVLLGQWRLVLDGSNPVVWPDNITLVDLTLTNFRLGGWGQNQLALRVDFGSNAPMNAFGWNTYFIYRDGNPVFTSLDQWEIPKFHAIVESTFIGNKTGADYNLLCDALNNAAVLGCSFQRVKYHNFRCAQSYKLFFAHNEVQGLSNSGDYHAVKLHAGNLIPYAEPLQQNGDGGWASRYIVFQSNTCGSTKSKFAWLVAICPQNDEVGEGIEDVLVYNNTSIRSTDPATGPYQTDLIMGGRRITNYGNSVAGYTYTTGIGHTGALPPEWNGPYPIDRS